MKNIKEDNETENSDHIRELATTLMLLGIAVLLIAGIGFCFNNMH